jgi:hypothetical protein
LRPFLFPTARKRFVQVDLTPKRRSPARGRDQKNSPSRFRFRPPLPLTFPFRVLPSDSVSTYLRSVLGARGTLTRAATGSRGRKKTWPQFAEISFFNISTANFPTCGRVCGKETQRRPNKRHAGATNGSVTRSRSLTHAERNGRARRTTTTAHASPTAQPASTSAG